MGHCVLSVAPSDKKLRAFDGGKVDESCIAVFERYEGEAFKCVQWRVGFPTYGR